MDIFLEMKFYKESYIGDVNQYFISTEKKLKGAFTAAQSPKNIPV